MNTSANASANASVSASLNGILPVLPTLFCESGEIDTQAMGRVVDFVLSAQVNGIVFPGFASEVAELRTDERDTLLKLIVEKTPKNIPVIAGASAPHVDCVIAHGKTAQALGIEYLMIQPPVSLGRAKEALGDFLHTITQSLPSMQIILQNAPAPRGADISPQTIVQLIESIPQITYIKEETLPSGPSISYLLAHKPRSLRGVIGGGGARYILDEYQRGACAAMPAVEMVDLHVILDKAWNQGDLSKARDIYIKSLPLLVLQAVYRMQLTKYVLIQRGILINETVRTSTPILDDQARADINVNLAELSLLHMPSSLRHNSV